MTVNDSPHETPEPANDPQHRDAADAAAAHFAHRLSDAELAALIGRLIAQREREMTAARRTSSWRRHSEAYRRRPLRTARP